MWRTLTRLGPISISGLLPLKTFQDHDSIDIELIKDMNQHDPNFSGMDRIKMMFTTREYEGISDELNYVYQSTLSGCLLGGIFGGIYNAVNAQKKFLETNQATSFLTINDAKTQMTDKMIIAFGKGGYKVGWRLAAFTFCYTMTTKLIQVYRAETSVWEYTVAGGLTGALYKINMGLKGMIAGGIAGTVLGVICGGMTMMILKATNMSMGDVHLWSHQMRHKRIKDQHKIIDTPTEEEKDAETYIMEAHDYKLKESGMKGSLSEIKMSDESKK